MLREAKRLFADHGFEGANIRSIAKAAHLNSSLIGHYFGDKAGLYRACLQHFGEERAGVLDHVLQPAKTKDEFRVRLELAIDETLKFHLADPEVLRILIRDMKPGTPLLDKKLEYIFVEFPLRLASYFDEGRTRGWVRADVEPLTLAGVLYFAFSGLLQVEFMAKRSLGVTLADAAQRHTLIAQTVSIVLDGAMVK